MTSKIKVDEIEESTGSGNITFKSNTVIPTGKTLTITDGLAVSTINSGTIADARISSSSITQHVPASDVTPVEQDILTLALHSAVTDNKAAHNLTSAFIDQFEDDTGLLTQTSVDRTSEMVASVYNVTTHQTASALALAGGNITGWGNEAAQIVSAEDGDASNGIAYTTGSSVSGYVTVDLGASYTINQMDLGKMRTAGDPLSILLTHSTDNSSYTNMNFTDTTQSVVDFTNTSPALSNFTSSGTADWAAHADRSSNVILRLTGFANFTARYIRLKWGSATFHDANAGWGEMKFYKPVATANATGTLISIANVPATAKTKVSGVALYKDNAGTATIGTDLKIYFTCDGGSNWTEAASYTAVTPVFSAGIKMLRLGETTCTSGSDIRYKVVWANQAASSKETQLHGMAVDW